MLKRPAKDASLEDLDTSIEEQISRARASRIHAETARQKITAEIMDATRRLYQTLVEEGEQTLERAKKLEVEAELKMLESQRELQHAQSVRQEADSYRQKVIAQTKEQSQEILQEAQTVKADAVAFREKLLMDVKQQTEQELGMAQSSRVAADAYRERVLAQTQRQSEDTLDRARRIAEQEGTEIKQKYAIEAQKVLAQAELLKAAAEEQLEAQRLYTEAANLKTESTEVLNQAIAKVNAEDLNAETKPKDPAWNPTSFLASQNEPATGAAEAPAEYHNKIASHYEELVELEPDALWSTIENGHGLRPEADESMTIDEPAVTEPETIEDQALEFTPVNPDISGLLPANELVMGLELNQRCRAYPMSTIMQKRVINDTVGGLDVLLTFGPPSELGMMFNRDVEGQSLTFEPMPKPHNGIALIKDRETGTIWEALTGRAISGQMAGHELKRLTSEYSFWFAWCQLHPTTEVYRQA